MKTTDPKHTLGVRLHTCPMCDAGVYSLEDLCDYWVTEKGCYVSGHAHHKKPKENIFAPGKKYPGSRYCPSV